MSEFKMTTVEEMEAATNRLLETGAKVGADAWQFRVKNQTPHCKFWFVYSFKIHIFILLIIPQAGNPGYLYLKNWLR